MHVHAELTLSHVPLQSGGEIALSQAADMGELRCLVVRCEAETKDS